MSACFDNAVEIHDTGEGQIEVFSENSSASFENYDIELDADDDTNESAETSQNPVSSAKEFWQRCNQEENDFTGINLTGVNLVISSQSYENLNLSQGWGWTWRRRTR